MSTLPAIDTQRPLKNAKHEAFAQAVATGTSGSEAYTLTIGGKGASARAAAARLLAKDSVRARVAAVQSGQKLKATHLTIEEKRDLFADVKRTAIADIDEHSPLCQEVSYFYGEGGLLIRKKIKMIDKLKAVEMDNQIAGHTTAAANIVNIQNNTLNVLAMSEPRRRELMDKKRAAIEKRLALPLKSANPPTIET